jgi:hypothetical protein
VGAAPEAFFILKKPLSVPPGRGRSGVWKLRVQGAGLCAGQASFPEGFFGHHLGSGSEEFFGGSGGKIKKEK